MGVLLQAQHAVGREKPFLTTRTPAMGAPQSDLAAIGVDVSGDPAFLVAQRALAVGTFFIHGIGLGLHGLLHQRPLQFQGGLADGFLDEPQALLGMLLHSGQPSLEIFPPTGDVQIQQAVMVLGDEFVDKVVNRFEASVIFRAVNSHGVVARLRFWVRVK